MKYHRNNESSYGGTVFLDVSNSKGEKVPYRVSYNHRDDYRLVQYVIHRVKNGQNMIWATNRGFGCYTTQIMYDTECVDIRKFTKPFEYNFGRFISYILIELEKLNEKLDEKLDESLI